MRHKPTRRNLSRRSEAVLGCSGLEDLARLLGLAAEKLLLLAANPQYNTFYRKKKSGKMRLIEEPVAPLKRVQDYLGDFLQAVYYFHRTPAAYGFMVHPLDDPDKRHVLSNATRHLGKPYLLNLDMEDFFHTVTQQRVQQLFEAPLFGFSEELSRFLAQLTCYNGRLPMGAPTSPVLSNIAAIPLDHDLVQLSEDSGWTYTRYADDMSFSSEAPIPEDATEEISRIVEMWEFRLNPEKRKYFGPNASDKSVTGLLVGGDKIGLAPEYLPALESAIDQLAKVTAAQHLVPSGRQADSIWVVDLRRAVFGKLEFARHVLGEDHFWVSRLRGAYYDALRAPEDYGALTWLEAGYDWDFPSNW